MDKGAPAIAQPGAAHRFEYEDLREWLALAEKLGEVRHVKAASWQSEIGMAAELVQHSDAAPCVVFDEVPGCAPGFRVLTNFFGGRRKNMTLGFPLEYSKLELSEAFLDNYLRALKTVPYVLVDDGPVFENVLMGDEVDVTRFPVPVWHEGDGGRYIGTGSYNVTLDPEEQWINVGTYRVMIHDRNTLGFYMSPGKHGRIHRDKYQARNEPMPVCIVAGGDPLTFLMACSEMPYGVCEFDIAGGVRGKPVKVVRGKLTGLPFPANAEIVLEGFVQPGKRRLEGPFGEWTGYYGSDVREEPVFDVKAVGAHEVGGSRLLLGVSIRQRYAGHSKQAGHVASQCHAGAYSGKYVIVVDEDIDVSDLEALIWAMLTRSDPASSIDLIHGAWSTPLDPRIPPEEKAKGNNTNSRAIIDACRPFHWRDAFPKVNVPSPEKARLAREKFGYLLG
ncbi:MAG TPA: UbiD family decarboxylase [Burkholderiales bacterium]